MFIFISETYRFILKFLFSLMLVTLIGQISFKNQTLENYYHVAINDSWFQKPFGQVRKYSEEIFNVTIQYSKEQLNHLFLSFAKWLEDEKKKM